jgi:hypothetical protein
MRSPGNGQRRHRISMAAGVADSIKNLNQKAIEAGIEAQVLAALKLIGRRLESDPGTFGEPIFELPGARLQVRMGIEIPLVVYFAVNQDQPWVFIQGIRPLSGHGLN